MTTTVVVTAGSVPAHAIEVRFGADESGSRRKTIAAGATETFTIDDEDSVTISQREADVVTTAKAD